MNGKCTDFPIAPVVQSDILGPQLDDVQRYCVVERVGALKGSEGSMQAPSSLQTDEHNHKDGGRNMYVNGSQAGEYRQASEMHAKPTRSTCAHEDQKLLCDLECAFRDAVRGARDQTGLWLNANAGTSNTTGPVTLHTPYKAVHSSSLQPSRRLVNQDGSARPKLLLPNNRKTTLLTGARGHRTLLGRQTGVSNHADLTWQLRKMFSKEVRRKQRKTSVLPKVLEATMESLS